MVLEFKNKEAFRQWLIENHETSSGVDIYMYKKGHENEGLTYEDAVQTALCYGWIDSVTHSYNDIKFRQYFAKRQKNSNWSLSNIKRVAKLISEGHMTDAGLKFFDLSLIDQIDDLIAKEKELKSKPVEIPNYFLEKLKETSSLELFNNISHGTKRRYLSYILDGKKEATRLNRCDKIIGILNGAKNNL